MPGPRCLTGPRPAATLVAVTTPPVTRAILLSAVLLAGCVRVRVSSGNAPAAGDAAAAVAAAQSLLAHGAAAWNAGDLDGFVSDYTDDATFVTNDGLVQGRAAIRARYAPRFAPGASRDSLRFEQVRAFALGTGQVHAVAWYVLERGGRVTARGPTSLVLRRERGRWCIAHDHSS